MFDSPDAARQIFIERFERPRIEMLVEALRPAVGLAPNVSRDIVIGGTRIGGTPDLPPGLAWPKPPAQRDPEAVARRANPDAGKELVAHYRLELPYLFVAQIDLEEAASLGPAAADLPGEGRLLFFYDMLAGPYDNGRATARVIWDRSARATLRIEALPAPLAKASAAARAERATWDDDRARLAKAGTNYEAPARGMRLKAELRPPARESLEAADAPALKALLGPNGDDAFAEAYSELLGKRYDTFYDPANSGHRNQLLGGPLPEQSDPRFDAVVLGDFGKQSLSREEWTARDAEIEAKARDWLLLLQIDVADLMQDPLSEGTVYFLIRKSDLAERRFDEVVAVYQQT